ncbi:hypothetical protein [Chitinophaga pinensis]|uniref:Uncharacterized protein n=1 Tax=Chitinophaga pinensis TaxID=79329 RepID=A0A5C6LN93_9BACT|nr:hypothetical protein [Chitinophaga pinensis]TWV95657.1 hypothetical protein FEF09_24480 [Chitinophaga pinensis]
MAGFFPDEDSSTFGSAGKLHTEAISYAAFLTGMMQHKVLTAESYNELLKKQVSVPRKHEFNANEGTGAGDWVSVSRRQDRQPLCAWR